MKLKKSLVAVMCAVGMMGISAGSASAGTITFDFNPTGGGLGSGLITGAATIDEAPGNALGVDGATTSGLPIPVGTTIQDYYQANLADINDGSSNHLFTNGAGDVFLTIVGGFTETVTSSTSGGGAVTNNFSVNPGGFFSICAQSAIGNDLAGTGFACSSPILTGVMSTGGFATQTGFPAALQAFDGFGTNNYPGITSVTSAGAATLDLLITGVNAGYFPDLLSGSMLTLSMTNSSLITPFNQVNPSALFSSNGVLNGNVANNIGAINGITGPNFQFQADANSSFTRAVPEPGTLALLGIAVVGMGGFLRRRRHVD